MSDFSSESAPQGVADGEYAIDHVVAYIETWPGVGAGGDVYEVELDLARDSLGIAPKVCQWAADRYGPLAFVQHWYIENCEHEQLEDWEF